MESGPASGVTHLVGEAVGVVEADGLDGAVRAVGHHLVQRVQRLALRKVDGLHARRGLQGAHSRQQTVCSKATGLGASHPVQCLRLYLVGRTCRKAVVSDMQ